MNLYTLKTIHDDICGKAKQLIGDKNEDYSTDENVHENFEIVALLCSTLGVDVTTPEGCIQFQILWKIQRLFRLVNSGKDPANESLRDTVVDLTNYTILLEAYTEDCQKSAKKE